MDKGAKIYVAGHRGMVGSALVRRLNKAGYENLLLRSHAELDLLDQAAVRAFLQHHRPNYVYVAPAKTVCVVHGGPAVLGCLGARPATVVSVWGDAPVSIRAGLDTVLTGSPLRGIDPSPPAAS
jgi:hypothetical protein